MAGRATAGVRLAAPAKINLTLDVLGRRPDGRHELSSLIAFSTIGDFVRVSPAVGDQDAEQSTGPFGPALRRALEGEDRARSLTLAALACLRRAGWSVPRTKVEVEKNLPLASGIGGGTSDAAACLRAARQLYALDVSDAALSHLMSEVGADGPACALAAPCLVGGYGERLAPLAVFPTVPIVLINAGVPVSTGQVFAALGAQSMEAGGAPSDVSMLPPHLPDLDAVCAWADARGNALETPAESLVPQIAACQDALRQSGARLVRMSGSGATVFGLFDRDALAQAAASDIAAREPGWWVQAGALIGTGAS